MYAAILSASVFVTTPLKLFILGILMIAAIVLFAFPPYFVKGSWQEKQFLSNAILPKAPAEGVGGGGWRNRKGARHRRCC